MQRTSFVRSTRNWWRGLIPLAAIWFATDTFMTGSIERDLASRATSERIASHPADASTPWASVRVAGRDAAIEGTAPAESSRVQMLSDVGGIWGVRLVQDRANTILAVHPFQWGAEHEGAQLTLSGHIPPGGTRTILANEVAQLFPGATLVDTTNIGGGASADFVAMSSYSLRQLVRLTHGKVALSDAAFSIRGSAATRETRDDIIASAQKLRAPLTLQSVDITAPAAAAPAIETSSIEKPPVPSYVWLARREYGRVILSGFVPDQAAHKAILAAAGRNFSGLSLDDKLKQTADGAPDGFMLAAEIGLAQFARLETGAATITDTQLTLIGLAETEDIASAAKAEVSKVAAGFSGDATIIARPKPVQVAVAAPTAAPAVADCTSELKTASTQGRIQFESLKSVILPESIPVIDGIANTLKRCPNLKVEVSGHTDNTGQSAMNRALSLRRATAVVSTLTKAGIERARLKPEGFGATRPVAKNETHQGRAANRRIEFTILK